MAQEYCRDRGICFTEGKQIGKLQAEGSNMDLMVKTGLNFVLEKNGKTEIFF